MAAITTGAGELANTLLPSLTAGKDFTFPEVSIDSDLYKQPKTDGALYDSIEKIEMDHLTTGKVGGDGVFDKLMVSLVNHLKVEYEANRISGAEYTKAYIGVVGAALQTAQQFILTKEQSYWAAILVQQQARAAEIEATRIRVELENSRVTLVRSQYEASIAEANYALTKIKIATEDAAYATQVAQTASLEAQTLHTENQTLHVQAQTLQTSAETEQVEAETTGLLYRNANLYPAQLEQTNAATANTAAQTVGVTYNNTEILPLQRTSLERTNANLQSQGVGLDYTNANILPKQANLLGEQIEVQRAQTADTRTDGPAIVGVLGKQKDLYTQQITSYQRDAETKGVKLYTDAWITMKTMDEGLLPPDQFTNVNLDAVLQKLRTNLNLTV